MNTSDITHEIVNVSLELEQVEELLEDNSTPWNELPELRSEKIQLNLKLNNLYRALEELEQYNGAK